MRFNQLSFAVILFLLFPFHLLAWGREGHQIVAKLAMLQLSESTKQKVLKVLGDMTPEQASTWMDEVRSTPQYKYTAPWHYADAEKGEMYQPAAGGDVITALNNAYNELQHMDTLSPERLRFDVLVLFHLCGDLVQPLHCGYASDKGGNDYQVQYNGKGTNLHHIWDTDIIESQGITFEKLRYDSMIPVPGETRIETLKRQQIDFLYRWEQNRRFLNMVYNVKGHKLDNDYMQKAGEVVHDQLFSGGFLLASCLEQVFSQAKNIPAEKSTTGTKSTTEANTGQQELLTKVPAEQAATYIGKKVSICGKVYSAKFQGGSGVTFINMGGEYPNNPFTAVIMASNRSNFNYKPEEYLNGKTICVIGTVKEYKGKSEIVVEKPEQILMQ